MPTHPDTHPNLHAALTAAAADHSYWSTPAARAVLDYALATLRPIALRSHADPADALSYAFEAWMGMAEETLADENADLWAYTRAAVRRSLDREDEANRRSTSVAALRRTGTRDVEITTGIDGIDIGYDHVGLDDEPEHIIDPRAVRARAALEQVLTLAGFTEDQRTIVIDVFADLIAGAPSTRAAIDRAVSVRELVAPHVGDRAWRNLVEVILGTSADLPGVMALAASGHPAPAMEKHISSRLLSVVTLAA